jgi:NADH-quinone oxidoreductase subunit J
MASPNFLVWNQLSSALTALPIMAQTTSDTTAASSEPATNIASEAVGRLAVPCNWTSTMLLPIALGAAAYLMIQHGVVKSKGILLGGIGLLAFAIGIAIGFVPVSVESYLLMSFCAVATAGGVGFLTAREPVHAALGFATAVLSTCGIMFMQSALFLAAATMIVYAGATIIIFLFVLMFAQQTDLRNYDVQLTNPVVAAAIGAILLGTITMCVTCENGFLSAQTDATRPYSSADLPKELRTEAGMAFLAKRSPEASALPSTTAGLGRALYTDYLIAVELAGTVLLVATIGAIALAQRPVKEQA